MGAPYIYDISRLRVKLWPRAKKPLQQERTFGELNFALNSPLPLRCVSVL